jgi:hypothetical protein
MAAIPDTEPLLFTPRVVHIVGEVVRSRGDALVSLSEPSAEPRFERAGDLVSRFAGAQLVIIQLPPRDHVSVRQASDRRDASYLIELACKLHERGMPLVVTIPALESALAAHVLEPLVDAAAGRTRGVRPLVEAIREMRRRIIEGVRDKDADGFELACDVTLHADRSWRSRVVRGPHRFDWLGPVGRT